MATNKNILPQFHELRKNLANGELLVATQKKAYKGLLKHTDALENAIKITKAFVLVKR